ncbi:MAG: hypothetical protein IT261_14030, partial [Saprospiraceae bacterium]|nr:hypothetical protein [Saprospiraceae bacterium]
MATQQTDGAYQAPDDGGAGGGLGKQLILIALITVAAIVGYKAFFADGGGFSGLFQEPKEVRMTYVPSDFNPNLDEEKTLRIL